MDHAKQKACNQVQLCVPADSRLLSVLTQAGFDVSRGLNTNMMLRPINPESLGRKLGRAGFSTSSDCMNQPPELFFWCADSF